MLREQGQITPQEAVNFVETEIRVAPPINPNELFGKTLQDGRNLTLTTNPLYMFEVTKEGSQPEQVVVLPPMFGQQFWHFINTIAPLPYKMRVDSLIDDWGMPDETAQEQYQKDRLARHEGSMGEEWNIFERSRHIFIDTLKFDPSLHRRGTWSLAHNFFGLDWYLEETFMQKIVATLETDDDLREGFGAFLHGRARFKNRKWLTSDPSGMYRRVSAWEGGDLRGLSRDFLVAALRDSQMRGRETLVGLFNDFETGASLDVDEGKVVLKTGKLLTGELNFFSDRGGKTGWTVAQDISNSTNFLLPTIRWTRDENQQVVLNFDFLDEALANAILPHVVPLSDDLQFDTRRLNPVAGFDTIPYFIPKLRKGWPKYQKIVFDEETGKYQVVPAESLGEPGAQFMSAQASSIVALQHKDQITQDAEFFDRAEEHIRKQAA